MRVMTKSAVRLARTALAVGEEALPRYAARTNRHDYTQAQLFALLARRHFLRVDYGGLVALVAERSEGAPGAPARGGAALLGWPAAASSDAVPPSLTPGAARPAVAARVGR
jgi:hypothetical protein